MRNVIETCIDQGDIRRLYILDEQRKEGRKEERMVPISVAARCVRGTNVRRR